MPGKKGLTISFYLSSSIYFKCNNIVENVGENAEREKNSFLMVGGVDGLLTLELYKIMLWLLVDLLIGR